jgi:P pilus assembly chaperone PapD
MDENAMILRPSRTITRRVRFGALAAVAVAATLLDSTRAAAQVSVEDLELRFVSSPTRAAIPAKTFRINNTGDAAVQATISVADWDRSDTGQNRYFPAGATPGSCAAALRVFPMVLRLEPHASEDVRVTVHDSTATACHSILFVETPPPPASTAGTSITYRLRYGVKIYVEPNAPLSGEILSSALVSAEAPGQSQAPALEVVYTNPGARQSLTTGEVQIRRPDDSVAARVPIEEFPVLPGAVRRLRIALPSLAAGRYAVLALLEFGGDEVVATQVEWLVP